MWTVFILYFSVKNFVIKTNVDCLKKVNQERDRTFSSVKYNEKVMWVFLFL